MQSSYELCYEIIHKSPYLAYVTSWDQLILLFVNVSSLPGLGRVLGLRQN